MSATVNTNDTLNNIGTMVNQGHSRKTIFEYLTDDAGYTEEQALDLFIETGLHSQANDKRKYASESVVEEESYLEALLAKVLSLGVTYVVPIALMIFGVMYVWGEMATDMNIGIRSAAAALMPMAVTLAFSKSEIRNSAVNFLSDNKMISFAFAFVLAMLTAGLAMYVRQYDNVIPIGELAFSTTLALMIFGNKNNGEVPFLHVGAVAGMLTYVILFGIPI
ncbi:MAG: hypothetical protein Phog2KO_47690 [Phototrophicaceae bacterium]